MRKYVFSVILALCLVAALLPGIPAAADGHGTNHTCLCGAKNCTQTGTGHEKIPDDAVWEGIGNREFESGTIGEAGHTHYYYLTEDINCNSGYSGIYFEGNVVLCLNGHDIDFSGGQNRLAIKPIADRDTKLTICDCDRTNHNCIVEYNDTYNNKKYDYTYYGGAIKGYRLDISSGTLNLYRCTITGSNNAAAINMASGTTLNMYDGANVLGNSVRDDSAVLVRGEFNMYGGLIAGNYANSAASYGGGVRVGGSTTAATFHMYDGTIQDNMADNGGGVSVTGGSTFNMHGGTIENNATRGGGWMNYGGGVLVQSGTFNMYGGTITGNQTGTGNGGGLALRERTQSTANIYGGTISNNTSHGYGGGIYVSGNTLNIEPDEGKVISITGNKAFDCPTEGHQTGRGGGMYLGNLANGTLTLDQVNISNNTAEDCGGGLFVSCDVNLEDGASITGNGANSGEYLAGGGVYLAGGTFDLNGGEISNNKDDILNGAGVYVAGGMFNLNSGKINGNKAQAYGGGVYVAGGTFNLNGGEISSNEASFAGGMNYEGGKVTINEGSTISGNTATRGAGIMVSGDNITMSGGIITDNRAKGNQYKNGGGVYIVQYTKQGTGVITGVFTMTGGKITGNTADKYGGGVYIQDNGIFNVSGDANVSGNTVNGRANNVYLSDTNAVLTITGTLSGAKFGITANANTPFTSGWSSYGGGDPRAFFSPDADDKYIALTDDNEVELRNGYQIKYELNGGQFVDEYTPVYSYVSGDQAITLPGADAVTRNGYTFDGWYENEDLSGQACTVIASGSTGPKTFYAKWTAKTYRVTLETNGGTIVGSGLTEYTCGQGAELPTNVEKSGYTFAGWYENDRFEGSAVTAISDTEYGDKTYYAKWMSKTYSVTLNTNGGTIKSGNVTNYSYGEGAALPTDVEKSGYTFAGWYGNEQLTGSMVTAISDTEYGDKTYYAKWTANTYSVKLHLNGGNLADGVSDITAYTYGNSIELPDRSEIVRSGYMFSGWYADEGFKDGPYTEISSTDSGNKEFYARWTMYNIPNTHAITVIDPANGSLKVNPSNGSAGTLITVTATPDKGYELAYITVDGERITGSTFRMPDHDVTVSALFVPVSFPFTDVKSGDWFYDAVAYVYANGLMDGTSATTFEPNANMTRAMVWAILARIDGETVTGADWASAARTWAMASGVSDGTDPNGHVTREQFATMLYRYAAAKGYDVSIGESTNILSYADFASISEYAIPAMQWACGSGIVTGVTDSTLEPQGTATRAQCAAMLMRFIEGVK